MYCRIGLPTLIWVPFAFAVYLSWDWEVNLMYCRMGFAYINFGCLLPLLYIHVWIDLQVAN